MFRNCKNKICKYMATRRLAEDITRIYGRFPGQHLPPVEIALTLLDAINITDECNWTSLHYSVCLGMERTSLKLLTSGADLNKKNDRGDTPLHLACRAGTIECIETILNFKPKINLQNDNLSTPLHIFLRRRPENDYILDKLLDAGANPDIPDEDGYSPLHTLALQVETEKTKTFARLLVEYKVTVDSQNKFKETPLHFAVDDRNMSLVEVLIESGASINIADASGITAMDLAIEKKTQFPKVFEYLAEHLIIQYCCGFSVNLRHLEEVCKIEKYKKFKESCEEEILLLKKTFAGGSTVTCYKILVSSAHTVARYLFNDDILASLVELDTESRILRNVLLKNFNAGLKRFHAMKLGITATKNIFPVLPQLCVDKLLEYLENDDFINMNEACRSGT